MAFGLGNQSISKVVAGMSLVAIAVVFTACGGSSNNSTPQQVANVPANQCVRPGTNPFMTGSYPGVNAYNYAGTATGCAPGQVPTCYANNGGLACLPQSVYSGLYNQGYNPMFYGFNNGQSNGLNNGQYMYGYQGYIPYTQSFFTFTYNMSSYGYYPNRYVQGCSVNSFMNTCGWGGFCRPVGYGNLGICVR